MSPPPSRQLPAVRLPLDVRKTAESLAIALTESAGRRLTIREVISACVRVADTHRDALLAELRKVDRESDK